MNRRTHTITLSRDERVALKKLFKSEIAVLQRAIVHCEETTNLRKDPYYIKHVVKMKDKISTLEILYDKVDAYKPLKKISIVSIPQNPKSKKFNK